MYDNKLVISVDLACDKMTLPEVLTQAAQLGYTVGQLVQFQYNGRTYRAGYSRSAKEEGPAYLQGDFVAWVLREVGIWERVPREGQRWGKFVDAGCEI